MTARRCLLWPHPGLRAVAADVPAITDEVRAIWRDMVDTMEAMPGYGLAAAAGQALGSLIARPVMAGGFDPYTASLTC